ncbi:MAG: TIGR03936 family radical SAM-associated protein [Gaiellales bacterium]
MTYRITFAVGGRARFLSHLETVDTLLSALRRAGFEIALSKGMKPRPLMSLALSRAVGVESRAELADVDLAGETGPDLVAERLAAQLPAGIEVLAVDRTHGRSAASRVAAVRYRIDVAEDLDWDAALARFLDAAEVRVTRGSPSRGDRSIDVRPFCGSISYRPGRLVAEIALTDAGTARPEELATAVAAQVGATPTITRLVRTDIVLRDEPVGAMT